MSTGSRRQVYVNVPVRDLPRAVELFSSLGFAFDPGFTDETAAAMLVNDEAGVMLVAEDRFKTFSSKAITDARTHMEMVLAVTAESRGEVDRLMELAIAAGASAVGVTTDEGFVYSRCFQDLDGHLWELFWMDPDRDPDRSDVAQPSPHGHESFAGPAIRSRSHVPGRSSHDGRSVR